MTERGAGCGRIDGFTLGNVKLTVADEGRAVLLTLTDRLGERPTEAVLTAGQSQRLRRLLAAAERRTALHG